MAGHGLSAPDGRGPARPAIRRLGAYDEHCLRVETAARPVQVGVLATLDARSLLDGDGRLRLARIRAEIARRLAGVPELRRVIFHPGPLAGGPLWIDDPSFRIEDHVDVVDVRPPGDDAALLATVEGLIASRLDRTRPLWRMWFVTGLPDGRIGLLVILHHALADGLAAMRLVQSLLVPPITASDDGPVEGPEAEPPPPWRVLVGDHLRRTIDAARRATRPSTWRLVADAARSFRRASARAGRGSRTSLNAPVGPRRRLALVRLDLRTARGIARAHDCGVHDVVLLLVAGGVRALLEARGEPVERLRPRVGIAVARFSPGHGEHVGNDIGSIVLPLTLGGRDLGARLGSIAADRQRAAGSQIVAIEPTLRAWLGRIPMVRRSMERQRMLNLTETYLPGPPVPISLLGAPVLDLFPLAPLAGNLGLSFVALSYAGRLTITVRADADRFPDLDVLTAAMERDWDTLSQAVAPDRGDASPSVGDEVGSAA